MTNTITTVEVADADVEPVPPLYRDVHKGIRSELFAVTLQAGRIDPADPSGRAELAGRVREITTFLTRHAGHEDAHVQPVIEEHLPDLAECIAADHARLEHWMDRLNDMAAVVASAFPRHGQALVHGLYLELAAFTGSYLVHQDDEERRVGPGLEAAIGPEACLVVCDELVAAIPPAESVAGLAVMLPSMNVDDRVDLLAGMRAGAPPEVFAGVWGLAGKVLVPADHAAVAARLGLA